MTFQERPTTIPEIGSMWVSTMNPSAIKVVTGHAEKDNWFFIKYIRLDTNTNEFEPRNQFHYHNKQLH